MGSLAIAIDLGTSGFRAQALDLRSGAVVSTAISTRHPLPGANVIDHLHFALEFVVERARELVVEAPLPNDFIPGNALDFTDNLAAPMLAAAPHPFSSPHSAGETP